MLLVFLLGLRIVVFGVVACSSANRKSKVDVLGRSPVSCKLQRRIYSMPWLNILTATGFTLIGNIMRALNVAKSGKISAD